MDENEFREAVLSYARSSRNGDLQRESTHQHILRNPHCGDEVEIRLTVADDRIKECSFRTRGCAICTASSAILDEILPGMTVEEVRRTAGGFEDFLFHGDQSDREGPETYQNLPSELLVFAPLQSNPRRRECVYLPWRVIMEMV